MLSNVKKELSLKVQKFLSHFSRTLFCYIPDYNDQLPVIHSERLELERQQDGYGIFFTINGFHGGKRDAAHLVSLNALFCDIDYPDKINKDAVKIQQYKNELVVELYEADALPTSIVETKNGLHVYWIFKEPIFLDTLSEQQRELLLTNYRKVEEAILKKFEGDPAAKDTSRVLRIPETYHQKNPDDPFLCKLLFYNEENTYTFNSLAEKFLREEPADTWAIANADNSIDEETKKKIEKEWPKLERPSYKKLLNKDFPLPEGMRNRALLVAAAACCLSGWSEEKTLEYFNEFHGLSIREIRKTIKSAYSRPYDFGTKNEVMQAVMDEQERAEVSRVASKVVAEKFKGERDLKNNAQKELYEQYEQVIAQRHPNLKYKIRDEFYDYVNGVYRPVYQTEFQSLIFREMLVDGMLNYRKVASANDKIACFKSLDGKTFFPTDENPDPNIINLQNGLLDIQTFELKPHSPNYISTVQIPVLYDKTARCPLWFKFMNDITDGDTEQVRLLQQIGGYCLTTDTSYQKAFIFLGRQGGNGKGVFTRTLSKIVGRENVANLKLGTITAKYGLTGLIGKRLNIVDEISGNYFESEIIKGIISGDPQTTEVKYKIEPVSFDPTLKLLFTVNELPKINDTSPALYRRFIISPFNRTFQNNPDNDLEKKFEAEKSGILNWFIEGLKDLRALGYFAETEKNREALQMFKTENSPLVEFLNTYYSPVPQEEILKYTIGMGDLYKQYRQYCQDSGYKPKSVANFTRELAHMSFEGWDIVAGKEGSRKIIRGIRPLRNFSNEDIVY